MSSRVYKPGTFVEYRGKMWMLGKGTQKDTSKHVYHQIYRGAWRRLVRGDALKQQLTTSEVK